MDLAFLTDDRQNDVIEVILISLISMLLCQLLKCIIFSIIRKSPQWHLLISTGGFPSSHSSFVVTLTIVLGMYQVLKYDALDWSFAVSFVFALIIIHDAMGVRLEASKHAKILNNMTSDMSHEEKRDLGFGKKGELKEMLGHRGFEVFGGVIVGIIVAIIGYFICN